MTRGLYDQHLHSRHSIDSQADPAANVESALANGLVGLTFTEHFDTHPDDWPRCRFDDSAYSAEIESLRGTYGDRIIIGKGIEVCYQPSRMSFVRDFLDRHSFDAVILSVHYFGGAPLHARESWAELDAASGTRRYLETVLEAARFCRTLHMGGQHVFDILGHLDLVKRYTHRFLGCHPSRPPADWIDEILRTCLEADLIPEINTSTLRQGLSETMPASATVARYAELGGHIMSIGSDAHRAEDVGAGLDTAASMLVEAGINRIAIFKDRRMEATVIGGRSTTKSQQCHAQDAKQQGDHSDRSAQCRAR